MIRNGSVWCSLGPAALFWLAAPLFVVAQEPPSPASQASGLGTTDAIPTISWKDASAFIGKEVFLVGKVVRSNGSRAGHVFLNFDADYRNTCTIFIRKENVDRFPTPPDKAYLNKLVKVRGFLYEHQGQPNLAVGAPDRIAILPDDAQMPVSPDRPSAPATRPAVGETITLASYNLLNLFDNADDPYTADETTAAKPKKELDALARSIRALNADILAVVEVENRGVLQQFVDVYLSDMGYEVVLFEGNDNRGIDVGLLSRLPVGPVTSHRHLRFNDLNGRPQHFQRDLLEVRIVPDVGVPFEMIVVHLKSKSGEDEGGLEIRLPEAQSIRAILDDLLKTRPDGRFVVCGDFNDLITSKPLQTLIGSGPGELTAFIDDLPENNRVTFNQPPYLSMIDFILASPAMAKQYVPKSYSIVSGSPETTGSDHNPVIARFRIR